MPHCKSCGADDHSRRTSKKCPRNVKYAQLAHPNPPGPNLLGQVPFELKDMIIRMLPIKSVVRLSMVDRMWNTSIDNDDFWERACRLRRLQIPSGPRFSQVTLKNLVVSAHSHRCVKCLGRNGSESVFFAGLLLCGPCDKTFTKITRTKAKTEYKLNDADLASLDSVRIANPHYRNAAPMTLFLASDVIDAAHDKHGGPAGLLEAVNKSEKRSAAIAATKSNRRAERHRELQQALNGEGIDLREDSVLCANYINGVSTLSLEHVVTTMVQMHILYAHSPYEQLLDRNMANARREIHGWMPYEERREYFEQVRYETKREAHAIYEAAIQSEIGVCLCGRPLYSYA